VIRGILTECAGVVAWGGDFGPPDESHFQIDVVPTESLLRQVANKIRGWSDTPGLGAGVMLAGV